MLHLVLGHDGVASAEISVKDDNGDLRASVIVEIYDSSVNLTVIDNIMERDSDDATSHVPILDMMDTEEKVAAPVNSVVLSIHKRALDSVLAALRLYANALRRNAVPQEIAEISRAFGEPLTADAVDDLATAINWGI